MNHQMDTKSFVISIDLNPNADRANPCETGQFTDTIDRLLEILTRQRLPATWAVSSPSKSPWTQRILAAGQGHEIALAADRSWVGATAGRTRFSRELTRQVNAARDMALPATTLILSSGAALDRHHDLLVKHGINMVRPGLTAEREGRTGRSPTSLCYGVGRLPAHVRFPGSMQWLPGGGAVAVRQTVKRLLATRATTHLAIDGPSLAQLNNGAIHGLNWILRHIAKQQLSGSLVVRTLAEQAAEWLPGKRRNRSQSILRKLAG